MWLGVAGCMRSESIWITHAKPLAGGVRVTLVGLDANDGEEPCYFRTVEDSLLFLQLPTTFLLLPPMPDTKERADETFDEREP